MRAVSLCTKVSIEMAGELKAIKEVIGSAAKNGKFGEVFTLVDLIPSSKEGEAQFASDVVFARAKLENGSGLRDEDVVIKRAQKNDFIRQMSNSDAQFYNEHLMYSEVLTFLEADGVISEIYPKSIHTNATLGENYEDDIIVVEDLRTHGYKLTKEKVFLDFDHCALALKSLGRFHALSYAKKQENMEEFLKIAGKLKDVRWGDEDDEDGKKFMMSSIERGILPLIESGEHVKVLKGFLNKLQDPHLFMKQLKTPEEPMAVICHGDFNRNNIVFKYDDSDKPIGVKFFDVATSRYASPVIDLAFFLTMNTTSELRNTHWDALLKIYHDALSSTVPKCKVPSLEELRTEMRKRAVYGYLICSFFLPMMMDETSKADMEEFSSLPPEVFQELARTKGGDKCTKLLTDLVSDMVKFDYL